MAITRVEAMAARDGIGLVKLMGRHSGFLACQAALASTEADLVLIEGFKNGDFPKLEVWRASLGKPPLWPEWPGIVAVASDTPLPAAQPIAATVPGLPRFDLSATAPIADFVLAHAAPR